MSSGAKYKVLSSNGITTEVFTKSQVNSQTIDLLI